MPAFAATLHACWLLRLAAAPALAEEPRYPVIAIEAVGVVDVVRGALVGPRTVITIGGRIAGIEDPDTFVIPPAALRVDGRGRFLIPGLVDMHVHLFNNATHRRPNDWAFPLFVANGVTGVREMSAQPADMPLLADWRAALARGDLIAPRVLANAVSVRRSSLTATRQQVRVAYAAGADSLKVFSDAREPYWRAILADARALQMPVYGHVPADVKLLEAATAGQRSNEHLMQVYEACSTMEARALKTRRGLGGKEVVRLRDAQESEVLAAFDQRLCDRTAAQLASTEQVQVPTLVLAHSEARGSRLSMHEDTRWPYLRSDEQARWERLLATKTSADEQLATRRLEVAQQIVKTLHAAGVRILAGTDAPMPLVYPGFSLQKELELLVESGLAPADALRAATIWPAEFLGTSENSGSIALGKRADLVLLDENPLREISNTQRIRAVVLDGRLLERGQLDDLLRRTASSEPQIRSHRSDPPVGSTGGSE